MRSSIPRWIRNFLIGSLVLNIMFFALAGVFIQKRGGYNYAAGVFSRLFPRIEEQKAVYNPASTLRYKERVSIFEEITIEPDMTFIGDSLIERAEWSEFFQDAVVINRGISGDTTSGVLNRLDSLGVSVFAKTRVFFYVGVNDLLVGIPDNLIIENYREMIEFFKGRPNKGLFIQNLMPLNEDLCRHYRPQKLRIDNDSIKGFNRKLKELAIETGVGYIDLYSSIVNSNDQLPEEYTFDGLHLNGKGYAHWVSIIHNLLK